MSFVVIITGGDSSEREVSLRSGTAVEQALTAMGHHVQSVDLQGGINESLLKKADVVFPALHGRGGESGELQARLEHLGIMYIGSDAAASKLCFDKWQYKQLLREHGLPTPEGEMVTKTSLWQSPLSRRPFVLKPSDDGSSVDTFIVRDPKQADKSHIDEAFLRHPKMLLEELIDGIEVTVAVLGDEVMPIVEIIPPVGGEFDYENKYNGQTQELCPPEHIPNDKQREAQSLALRVHKLCGCRDLSRTDIMIARNGKLWLIETNTIPGLTDQSLYPKAGAAHGLSYGELTDRLVQLALARL